jgi:hypothetical protein
MLPPRPRAAVAELVPGVLALAVALAVAAPRMAAAVDMTGDWYAAPPTGPASLVHFTQTGAVLQTSVGASGTIDSATGAFTLVFPPVDASNCGAVLQGQVAPTGATFVAPGTFAFTPPDCQSIGCACSGSGATELVGSRSACGNGVVDVGEACDDGSLGRGASCCALGCTARPDGTSCDDGLFCDGQETTCVAGVCQQGAPPCPLACDEATDACGLGCPSAPKSCRAAGRSRLLLKRGGDGIRDRLSWKLSRGAATTQSEFADPSTTTPYAICIFAGASPALVGGLVVPPDPLLWKALGTAGFKYKDRTASAAGIERIVLKGSPRNSSKVQVAGRGLALPDVALPVVAPVTVQLLNGTSGLCWDATYAATDLLQNDGGALKAKTP